MVTINYHAFNNIHKLRIIEYYLWGYKLSVGGSVYNKLKRKFFFSELTTAMKIKRDRNKIMGTPGSRNVVLPSNASKNVKMRRVARRAYMYIY